MPVSVKGIVLHQDGIVLLKNERDEWELPGGKIESGEELESCIVREISEELSLQSNVSKLIDVWIYHVNGVDVLIITYLMKNSPSFTPIVSHEHKEVKIFPIPEISNVKMPQGYKDSINKALGGGI